MVEFDSICDIKKQTENKAVEGEENLQVWKVEQK